MIGDFWRVPVLRVNLSFILWLVSYHVDSEGHGDSAEDILRPDIISHFSKSSFVLIPDGFLNYVNHEGQREEEHGDWETYRVRLAHDFFVADLGCVIFS